MGPRRIEVTPDQIGAGEAGAVGGDQGADDGAFRFGMQDEVRSSADRQFAGQDTIGFRGLGADEDEFAGVALGPPGMRRDEGRAGLERRRDGVGHGS